MSSIIQSFEGINRVMQECIKKEIRTGGLLEDVETFIPIFYHDSVIDEPVIWMTQHPSTAESQADLSQSMVLITPFEFDCAVYKPELEDAQFASQNLATRVVLAVTKNFLTVQKELFGKRIIKNIRFQTFYPVGDGIAIQGKSDKLPATGVILNVVHPVNWIMCCKQLQNNQGE